MQSLSDRITQKDSKDLSMIQSLNDSISYCVAFLLYSSSTPSIFSGVRFSWKSEFTCTAGAQLHAPIHSTSSTENSPSEVVPLFPTPSFCSQCSRSSSPPRSMQAIFVQTCTLNFPRGLVVNME